MLRDCENSGLMYASLVLDPVDTSEELVRLTIG